MSTIRKNITPLSIFAVFFIIGLIPCLLYSRYDIQIWLNQFFNPVANTIFQFFTKLAEGWLTIPLLIGLMLYNWRKAIFIGIIYAVSSGLVQFLKRAVFHQLDRPRGEKELVILPDYQWLPGVDMPNYFAFPSGHTTTAFCLFFGLALLIKNKKIGSALMVVACLVGFSRTYLSYHFLMDVVAGSFLGVAVALGMYLALRKKLQLN